MNGPEHYCEAERLLDVYKQAHLDAEAMPDNTVEQFEKRAIAISTARVLIEKAQVHATLANAAAVIEAADRTSRAVEGERVRDLSVRPMPAGAGDPAYPGSAWGRAFYGELQESS